MSSVVQNLAYRYGMAPEVLLFVMLTCMFTNLERYLQRNDLSNYWILILGCRIKRVIIVKFYARIDLSFLFCVDASNVRPKWLTL